MFQHMQQGLLILPFLFVAYLSPADFEGMPLFKIQVSLEMLPKALCIDSFNYTFASHQKQGMYL